MGSISEGSSRICPLTCHKVGSINMSQLEGFTCDHRLLMKGKFNDYLQWHFLGKVYLRGQIL